MRISCEKNDYGYVTWLALAEAGKSGELVIYLDGVKVNKCVTADSTIGMVRRYRCHDNGELVNDNGELCIEELWGKVVIIQRGGDEN